MLLFLLRFLAVFPSRSPIGGEGNSIASATTSESDCLSVLVGWLGYLFLLLLLFLPPPPFSQGGKVRKEGGGEAFCLQGTLLFVYIPIGGAEEEAAVEAAKE